MNLAMILASIDAVVKAIALISMTINEVKRQGEWTPEQEAEVDARMKEAFGQDHWRPSV